MKFGKNSRSFAWVDEQRTTGWYMSSETTSDASGGSGPRRAILVLGMHRSGTSILTRILSLLGADLPATLMPADPNNETGYWESTPISQALDRILRDADSHWTDWRPFDPEWHHTPAAAPAIAALKDAVASEFGEAPLVVLKDPRMCRLIPLMANVLRDLAINPCAAIIIRHPTEVADSLAKRDRMSRQEAGLLWLRHLLDAERDTREWRRAFVNYTQVLENWEAVALHLSQQLHIQWPRAPEVAHSEVDQILSDRYRHNIAEPDDFDWAGASWHQRAYLLADDYARGCTDLSHSSEFDALSTTMAEAARPFQAYIDALEAGFDDGAGRDRRSAAPLIPPFRKVFPAIAAYLDHSAAENRELSAEIWRLVDQYVICWPFDEAQYVAMYPDVLEDLRAGRLRSAWDHFRIFGYFESRLPIRVVVDENWYLQTYPDVADALRAGQFESADQHFFNHGYRDGRLPRRPLVEKNWYAPRYLPGSDRSFCEDDFVKRGYLQGAIPVKPR